MRSNRENPPLSSDQRIKCYDTVLGLRFFASLLGECRKLENQNEASTHGGCDNIENDIKKIINDNPDLPCAQLVDAQLKYDELDLKVPTSKNDGYPELMTKQDEFIHECFENESARASPRVGK